MKRSAIPLIVLILVLGIPAAVFLARQEARDGPGASGAGAVGRGDRDTRRTPEERAALQHVQGLLDVIARRDTAAVADFLLPGARLVSLSTGEGEVQIQIRSRQDFARSLAGSEAHFLERMWDAEVRIDGPLAMVWAPYDFHVDGEFSHCGVDLFDLVHTGEGWRIVSVTYTRHPPGGCEYSPLGRPFR